MVASAGMVSVSIQRQKWLVVMGLALLGVPLAGCPAVYPELHAPMHPPRKGAKLDPPPPSDLFFITFKSAEVPPKTPDGRSWDTTGGAKPDPYAILKVGGRELIHTPTRSNTLHPTWPGQTKANYVVKPGARVRVELWDSNPIDDHPICVKNVSDFRDGAETGTLDVSCDSGAHITLQVEPAHARIGLGLYYELRTVDIFISRVVKASPAGRVGLKKGDQILRIQGKDVSRMQEGDAQSLINANAPTGVALTVKHADGKVEDVTIKNGPIYPTRADDIPVK